MQRWLKMAPLMVLPLLSGCAAMYFMQGKGKQPAEFTIPKDKRVLVFVDVRQGVNAPADFSAQLGEKISNHLFKYNAASKLVSQERLTSLKHDQDAFSKMGVADVVRACDADLAIYVEVVTLNIASTTDGSLSGANSQCFVKAVDANGVRMWPSSETAGALVGGAVDPAYSDSRTEAVLMDQLEDQLALRTGRMFHEYSRDDTQITK